MGRRVNVMQAGGGGDEGGVGGGEKGCRMMGRKGMWAEGEVD